MLDREGVRKALSEVNFATDGADLQALAECYTEDVVFQRRDEVIRGREAFLAFFMARGSGKPRDPNRPQLRHPMTSCKIDLV